MNEIELKLCDVQGRLFELSVDNNLEIVPGKPSLLAILLVKSSDNFPPNTSFNLLTLVSKVKDCAFFKALS